MSTSREPTLAFLAMRFIGDRRRLGEIGPGTARTYTAVIDQLVRHLGRDGTARRLTRPNIEAWLISRDHLAASTRRAQLQVVRTWCKWLLDNDYLRRDPTYGLKGPRAPRLVPRGRPAEEVATLLAHVPDNRARAVVLLMVQEGLRCGEVARLELGDVDLAGRCIVVHGKGGHMRALPLSEETAHAIDAYLAEHPAASGPLVRRYDRDGGSLPHGLAPHYVSDLVRRWMADAGVKRGPRDGVSGHALRHTAATDMLRNGAHVRDVQAALGHQSLATTQRYMPAVVNDLRQAMGGRSYRAGTGRT